VQIPTRWTVEMGPCALALVAQVQAATIIILGGTAKAVVR
jgi:hypothetical protein